MSVCTLFVRCRFEGSSTRVDSARGRLSFVVRTRNEFASSGYRAARRSVVLLEKLEAERDEVVRARLEPFRTRIQELEAALDALEEARDEEARQRSNREAAKIAWLDGYRAPTRCSRTTTRAIPGRPRSATDGTATGAGARRVVWYPAPASPVLPLVFESTASRGSGYRAGSLGASLATLVTS